MCVTLNLVYTPEYFISSGISGGVSYSYGALSYLRTYVQYLLICFDHHFYFPAQLVGGFTLSDLLDKPWSQVSSLLPPGIGSTRLRSRSVRFVGKGVERIKTCDTPQRLET